MRDGRRILDADAHVVEPGEVFGDAERVGPELMDLPPTTPFEAAGDTAKLSDFFESGCAADAYLRCMDTEGIDAVVLYPSIGLYVPYLPELDPKGSAAACRAYNDWIAGYCATDPSRLAGVGIAPLADVTLAVDAARRRRRARPPRRDGAPQPPLRPQPRRARLRPALRRARGDRPRARRARGPRRPRRAHDRARRQRDVRRPPRHVAPDGADGGDGEPHARRRARTPPRAARRVPRVGHRVAAVLAGAPRRPRRVDARHRDGRAVAVALGVLRPAVRDQHRSRRPAGGVDRVAGRRRPRRVGQRLPASRRACTRTPSAAS